MTLQDIANAAESLADNLMPASDPVPRRAAVAAATVAVVQSTLAAANILRNTNETEK